MSNTADIAAATPNGRGKLDELMLAMDVVDTLRHREDLVARELDDAGKQEKLLENLRRIYREQGIEVRPAGRLLVRSLCMLFDHYLEQQNQQRFSRVI